MKWIIRGYAIVLLAYTGWRTYDFMIAQLPTGDLSTWLAIFFLFSTEAGLALWHEISLHHITTNEQRLISVALTWVDFAGSLSAGIADMILRQSFYEGYAIPQALALFLLYGLPGIVAINIAGVLYYFSNDADVQLEHAKKATKFEITKRALRELEDNQDAIAENMKKDIFEKLREEITGKVARKYLRNVPLIPPVNGKSAAQFNAEIDMPAGKDQPVDGHNNGQANPTRPSRRNHN